MKKLVIIFLTLALLLNTSGSLASPEDMVGQVLADFSVNTINGSVFSLSESLKSHDLVLINFWATWCGPCCMEFPFLEAAWEKHSDSVDVIALSVEESDTFDVLKSFASDYNLHFNVGRDEFKMFNNMDGSAIPTTLIVNKDKKVVAVEIGSKSSAEEFMSLFDNLLATSLPSTHTTTNRCVLFFRDVAGNPIPGVTVAFCNGEYTPVQTDNNGYIAFDGSPNEYHVHLLEVPYGYSKPWEELHISGDEYNLIVTLSSER